MCERDDWKRREWKREWGEGFSLQSSNCAAHFLLPTELKRSGNWKGDNPAAKAPQMPMKSFSDIRVLHFGPSLCISFTRGSWKKWLYNGNTWKVFSIRLMHHCQCGMWEMKPYCFSLDERCHRGTAGWTERERESWMEGEEERDIVCSLNAKYIEM